MVGRNRRVRILALALFGVIAFVLYSRSSTSYEEYKQYAEKKYEDAVERAGGSGGGNGVGGGAVIRPPTTGDEEKGRAAAGLLEASESAKVARTTSTALVGSTSSRRVEEVAVETTSSVRVAASPSSSSVVPETTAYQGLPGITDDNYLPQQGGQGRVEVEVPLQQSSTAAIHWTSSPEHFPVATTIQLPTNKPSPIPKIQHEFKETEDKGADLERLEVIKAAASHAWYGYREKAWGQDEVMPLSGSYKNPFNAWGATLVDALDTLWILGMTAEFDEAVGFVETIDFTTTPRADIPLFETTIRYLGGLLAAYDVSGKKYTILLDKAVELGEVLYGAFDTPNRMPQTYYHWKPAFASQPHRASSRVVLAELGSLSMEFTRLAQLTGEPKFYDAIARITDGFYDWQNNTRLPGMWPTYIDASGCGKPAQMSMYTGNGPSAPAPDGIGMMSADQPVKVDVGEKVLTEAEKAVNKKYQESLRKQAEAQDTRIADADTARKEGGIVGKIAKDDDTSKTGSVDREAEKAELRGTSADALPKSREADIVGKIRVEDDAVNGKQKRQLDDYTASKPTTGNRTHHQETQNQQPKVQQPQVGAEVCIPKGLDSPSVHGQQSFTLAGMSDSTYEYLPKMHLLLAGRVEQYKEMYLASADAAIERLIYRPMIKDDWDILAAGDLTLLPNSSSETGEMIETFKPVSSHLVCFAGGMFALGGKIFDRPEDVMIGKKLTDGCVWSYNVTATGIMPEDFWLSKCESKKNCPWNETKYWDELDPYREQRTKVYTPVVVLMTDMPTLPGVAVPATKTVALEAAPTLKEWDKRQLDSDSTADDDAPAPPITSSSSPTKPEALDTDPTEAANKTPIKTYDINAQFRDSGMNMIPQPAAAVYTPSPPMSHKDFVEHKIAAERLPPGFTKIMSKSYILRPEAIESVFYMYRITGDQYWRDRGWEMFTAVQDHTRTVWGNSAIDDVTKKAPEMKDSEESFWLAETLKYFYLLFDEPEKWSLDDWVLNTEAHFFKRTG